MHVRANIHQTQNFRKRVTVPHIHPSLLCIRLSARSGRTRTNSQGFLLKRQRISRAGELPCADLSEAASCDARQRTDLSSLPASLPGYHGHRQSSSTHSTRASQEPVTQTSDIISIFDPPHPSSSLTSSVPGFMLSLSSETQLGP